MTDPTITTSARPAGIHVRRGEPRDAAALADFAARTFRETFAAQNTPDDIAAYLSSSFSPDKQAAELADPTAIVLLAFAEDARESSATAAPAGSSPPPIAPSPAREPLGEAALAGYAHLTGGEPPPDVRGPAPIELKRFYVAAEWKGRGLAQALMLDARRAAAASGARTLWLGVWEHNPRAIAFYRKCGFIVIGSHDFLLGQDRQTDVLMALSLDD